MSSIQIQFMVINSCLCEMRLTASKFRKNKRLEEQKSSADADTELTRASSFGSVKAKLKEFNQRNVSFKFQAVWKASWRTFEENLSRFLPFNVRCIFYDSNGLKEQYS